MTPRLRQTIAQQQGAVAAALQRLGWRIEHVRGCALGERGESPVTCDVCRKLRATAMLGAPVTVSAPGSAVRVTEYPLTERGAAALRVGGER